MDELVGIIIFSGFMLVVVVALVANLLVALYRERSQRRDQHDARDGTAGD
jgi:hypothetical protein